MLRRLFNKSAVTALLVCASTPLIAWAVPEINQPAPAFSGKAADGKTINLADFKGKTVVLEWTNHECPFVKKHYESGNIPALQKDATAKGVIWLQVISSGPGEQGQVDGPAAVKINGYRDAKPTNTILDPQGQIGKLYGAQTTPHIFIIDAQGKLAYKGGIDSIASTDQRDISKAEPYVANALKALAAGQPIAKPVTRAYGCSVKYTS